MARSVLFLNRVYPPVEGATGQLLAELAPRLVEAGWEVTVVTSRPEAKLPAREVRDGVRLERVRGLPFSRGRHWKRALAYLSLYPALLGRALSLPRADVVVTLTDPPLQLFLGPLLQRWRGGRLIHWAQDVYPELAEELGVLRRDGWLARVLRRISTAALRRHDQVIAVGRCMKERLLTRGLSAEAVHVIPNWANREQVHPIAHAANPFRAAHGLEGKFVVMYSGNLGLAHPFEAMIDAAARLQAMRPEIVFLFVGSGPRLPWVQEQVQQRGLTNVRFLPPQPLENLGQSLGAADVHLASMLENLNGLVVPSKVYGVLAAGRPCVFLGPSTSEAARTIRQHDCGEVLSSPDGTQLSACLLRWADNPLRRQRAGAAALRASQESGLAAAVQAILGLLQDNSALEGRRDEAAAQGDIPGYAPLLCGSGENRRTGAAG